MFLGHIVTRSGWVLLVVPLLLELVLSAQSAGPAPQSVEFFETRVRPLLVSNCYDCHTDQPNGGLRVDSREALLRGGRRGPAIVPGDPDKSLLIQAVRQSDEKLKMPKGGRLAPADVDALTEWIRAGAIWPAAASTPTRTADAAPTSAPVPSKPAGYIIRPEQRAFWSFQPLRQPPVPLVGRSDWAKSDIDRFILARLEQEGPVPVRAADKLTLIRRASLD